MYATRQTTENLKLARHDDALKLKHHARHLALFDFDHTLCRTDSFSRFIFYTLRKRHIVREGLKILPWIQAYYLGLYPPHKIRVKLFAQMFQASPSAPILALAQQYQATLIQQLDCQMWQQLLIHRARGDRIIVVSASVDVYLQPFCDALGIELLCSRAEIENGYFTGRYIGADCSAMEKAKRIQGLLNLEDYSCVYAYGNSIEDTEMLALADVAYWHGRGQELPKLTCTS